MKPIYFALFACFILMISSSFSFAVVPTTDNLQEEIMKEESGKKIFPVLSEKKQKKLEKRLNRIEKKLQKKSGMDSGIFDEARFRLGAVVFLAGIALLILAGLLFGLGGILLFVANIAILIGLILMIWSAVEYF